MEKEVEEIQIKIKQLELRLNEEEKKNKELDLVLNELSKTKKEELQFAPPSSQVEPTFFKELSERKLNVYKLSEDIIDIYGAYSAKFNRVEVR